MIHNITTGAVSQIPTLRLTNMIIDLPETAQLWSPKQYDVGQEQHRAACPKSQRSCC